MSVNFATVVEIEEQRDEIYQNYLLSQQQEIDNTLEFSSDMNRLEEMLNEGNLCACPTMI